MQTTNKVSKQAMGTSDIVFGGLFAALMAVGAFIHIVLPLGPSGVTISLQIFFAVLAGLFLGPKKGTLAVSVYLILGLIGLPIYAHGGGIAYVLKPTYGFLIGFAAAAFAAGLIHRYSRKQTFLHFAIAAIAGEMVYYAVGLVYYYIMFNFVLPEAGIGVAELMSVWFLSTVIPDAVICLGAAFTAWQLLPQLGAILKK